MRTAQFDLATPRYRLHARGVSRWVSPDRWDGASVARAASVALQAAAKERRGGEKPIIVGAVPCDSATPAMLYIPEEVDWSAENPAGAYDADPPLEPIDVRGRDSPAYRASVAEALRRIGAGALDKVVLARRVSVEARNPIDCDRVYARLCARNKSAYVYRVDLPAGSGTSAPVLLGASPELVLGSHQGRVRSVPLAGSTPRMHDDSADAEAARALLTSQKDLHEHALVVKAVGEVFRRHAEEVRVPRKPQLVQTPVIWHLGTHVSGQLCEGVSPISLAYALHPTPAVSGWPQEAARRAIAELEDFDRGFYAGLVGWMDGEGNGEWALALRCGVVVGNVASVFAGAGIVADSDPEMEHAETAAKLRTFINALGQVREPAPAAAH